MSGLLAVRLIEARDLVDKALFGKASPFVVLQFQHQTMESHIIKNSLSPRWNQTFTFHASEPTGADPDTDLIISVWDKDFFKNGFLGMTRIRFRDFVDGSARDVWCRLEKRTSRSRVRGEIHIYIQYTREDNANQSSVEGTVQVDIKIDSPKSPSNSVKAQTQAYSDDDLAGWCVLEKDEIGNMVTVFPSQMSNSGIEYNEKKDKGKQKVLNEEPTTSTIIVADRNFSPVYADLYAHETAENFVSTTTLSTSGQLYHSRSQSQSQYPSNNYGGSRISDKYGGNYADNNDNGGQSIQYLEKGKQQIHGEITPETFGGEDEEEEKLFREYLKKLSTCRSCGKEPDGADIQLQIITLECDHSFCKSCLNKHVKNHLSTTPDISNLGCPCIKETPQTFNPFLANPFQNAAYCGTVIPEWVIKDVLSPTEFDAFLNRTLQTLIDSHADFFRCPNQNCGSIMERIQYHSSQVLVDKTAIGIDGKPLSPEALNHREEFRFRCRGCSTEFCSGCKIVPYHMGFTCESYKSYLVSRKCRFCASPIKSLNKANVSTPGGPAHSNPALIDICTNEECQAKMEFICKQRPKDCGHYCCGIAGESPCLPCLNSDCIQKSPSSHKHSHTQDPLTQSQSHSLTQNSEDYCNICWVEDLGSAPCVRLDCGHVFHYSCIKQKLKKRWPTPRITFGFMECPLCKQVIAHKALTQEMAVFLKLFEEVQTKALQRLEYEGLARDKAIVEPTSKYYKKPAQYAMDRFAYFMCIRCSHPYFAGQRRCDAGDDAEKQFNPEDLVCGGCSGADVAQDCPKHGKDFMEFKCQFCCTVASWYCWGKTHFCNDCHTKQQKGDYLTKKPKTVFPVCPGPDQCPLHVKHPHVEEFMLGCAVCRNLQSF
eukprot:TRINITY_DN7680_c0_g1_i2.p1 TRINITY_DN7680_c0_g1~~TRINITY_DN7680_c0_g1_i2.p1  ORF type:complete len:879 (-),score=146.63 TRINITY_DN7680_c0_g1_i2:140-2776(-)